MNHPTNLTKCSRCEHTRGYHSQSVQHGVYWYFKCKTFGCDCQVFLLENEQSNRRILAEINNANFAATLRKIEKESKTWEIPNQPQIVQRILKPAAKLIQLINMQHGKCSICGLEFLDTSKDGPTIDHMLPLSRHGNNSMHNTTAAHSKCNNKKGSRILPYKVVHSQLGKGPVYKIKPVYFTVKGKDYVI